jgi:Ca2+-transporting ATPase
MRHYLETLERVFAHTQSVPGGLDEAEAQRRLEQNGRNALREAKKESLAKRFLRQLLDPMILILLGAAVISAVLAVSQREFPADVMIILVVVLINAILGVYQENKAEAAIAALQKMSAATSKALRGGRVQTIKSEALVVGDVILLEAGDAVPADARVFESASLKIEEAALTGESVPVNKRTAVLESENNEVALGDRKNMVYMGSSVAYGRGQAVVVATGMDTEMGKIADAIAQAEEGRTPLQIKLAQLSKVLTYSVLGICGFIFLFSVVRQYVREGNWGDFTMILDMFMVAVSLAVAAIPEGLAAVVTIVLSMGVTKMSGQNAIIRRLTAVETLGCAQIICSDKTGTLTQNKMTVVDESFGDPAKLATAMALCTDAVYIDETQCNGEPTEVALVNYAAKRGYPKPALALAQPRKAEAPFDSMRKKMSTIHAADGHFVQYTKGAPDEILNNCTRIYTAEGVIALTPALRNGALEKYKQMAGRALRVLAAAYTEYAQLPEDVSPEAIEKDLIFLGLYGMIDPVRPEVKAAIEECRAAGIRPIMITGDHIDTAVAIATELGILEDAAHATTGATVGRMSEEEFDHAVGEFSVYARVQPEHKVRIVNAWRKNGYVTAMTGDGVNDAPSIKSADIGVGMGITGTDVTKNVADMVLADDNFATIVGAVAEGRRIYTNIRKAIQFLLGSNLSEVLLVFTASLLSITILKPVHLLWINLVTDCFPALALGMEKSEHDIMRQRPRDAKAGIFSGGLGVDVCYQGVLVAILTFLSFFIGEFLETGEWIFHNIAHGQEGMTMAFLTMNMAEMFHSFNMRSQRGSLATMTRKTGSNLWLVGSLLLSFALTCFALFVPFMREAFDFMPLDIPAFCIAILLALSIIPLVELVKIFQRGVTARKTK